MIIDFYNINGGSGGSGMTPEEVQVQIDSALTVYTPTSGFSTINGSAITDGTAIVIEGGSTDLTNYWNSAQTESAIAQATEDFITSADAKTQIEAYGYITGVDLSDYWTSAQTSAFVAEELTTLDNGIKNDIIGEHLYDTNTVEGVLAQANIAHYDSGNDEYVVNSMATDDDIAARIGVELDQTGTVQEILEQAGVAYYDDGEGEYIVNSMATEGFVEDAITAATENFITSADAKTQIEAYGYITGVDLSDYWTSAITEEHIESAASIVYSSAASYADQAVAGIDLSDYYTSAQTETAITSKGYITNAALTAYTPTTGFSTINGSAITAGGNLVIQGGSADLSAYWTSAETQSAISTASGSLQTQIDTMDEVVADALNDINGELANKVSSSFVKNIWKGTQAQYDAISAKTATTLYIII